MGKVRFHPKIDTKYTYDKLLWPETHNGCTGCEDYWPDADYRALQAKLAALVGAGGLAINAIEALNAVLEPDSNEGVQVAWNMTFRARDRLNAAIAAAEGKP